MNFKATSFLLLQLFVTGSLMAQPQWSTPERITSGSTNDIHPTLISRPWAFSTGEEVIAFSRNGKDICIMTTTGYGEGWDTSVVHITTDSANHDFPSLASTLGFPYSKSMVVWQGMSGSVQKIFYSLNMNSQWTAPQVIVPSGGGESSPCVAFIDTTFSVVWETSGRIAYSEFRSGVWSPAEFITVPEDSLNSEPQLVATSTDIPVAAWTSRQPFDTTHSIRYSYRRNGTWAVPAVLYDGVDSRRPRFGKPSMSFASLRWESWFNSRWQLLGSFGYWQGPGSFVWSSPTPGILSQADQTNGSFNDFSIITGETSFPRLNFWYLAGAWESRYASEDSITLASYAGGYVRNIVAAPSSVDRHPTVSSGLSAPGGVLIWTVWENNSTGNWKLYATKAVHPIAEVSEDVSRPQNFSLEQNYPNPFNPVTKFEYDVPRKELVTIKVIDILGREVSTLMSESKEPGRYTMSWDGAGHASGVYLLQMTAGSFRETRKLLLIK